MASKTDFTPEKVENNRRRRTDGWTCGDLCESQWTMGRDERDAVDGDGDGGNAAER